MDSLSDLKYTDNDWIYFAISLNYETNIIDFYIENYDLSNP